MKMDTRIKSFKDVDQRSLSTKTSYLETSNYSYIKNSNILNNSHVTNSSLNFNDKGKSFLSSTMYSNFSNNQQNSSYITNILPSVSNISLNTPINRKFNSCYRKISKNICPKKLVYKMKIPNERSRNEKSDNILSYQNKNDLFSTNADSVNKTRISTYYFSCNKRNKNVFHYNYLLAKKESEPSENFNLNEFIFLSQIDKGTHGQIFRVRWVKNNKEYAIKKELLKTKNIFISHCEKNKIIKEFIKNTLTNGFVKIYGDMCTQSQNKYIYYTLMELCESDWEKELEIRCDKKIYYTEKEITIILFQLITILSLMQKNHLTHRDIKPKNILINRDSYKICDFGEGRKLSDTGNLVQGIRGTELYMSPILFFGLHMKRNQIKHNTYKSDVFSLAMCILFASSLDIQCLAEIREETDMEKIKKIINKYLDKRYSRKYINLLILMLQVDESLRPDFIKLENIIINYNK